MDLNIKKTVVMDEGEFWWGSSSSQGELQPFSRESVCDYDMYRASNQTMPLFISSKGRYIWCDSPMKFHIEN